MFSFYVVMQGAMWLGTQKDPMHLPQEATSAHRVFGLLSPSGEWRKNEQSRRKLFHADQLVQEKGYSADQIRYFLATLSLPEKASNLISATLDERNKIPRWPDERSFRKTDFSRSFQVWRQSARRQAEREVARKRFRSSAATSKPWTEPILEPPWCHRKLRPSDHSLFYSIQTAR